MATVYQGLGQNEEAGDQLRRALDLQPSNDDAHRILARVLAAQGKPEQAIAELQQALAFRPRRWMNYNALGRLYYDLRRLPEAAATFQRALEIAPDDARTYLSLGGVHLEMGDFDRAIEMFDRSSKIAPTGLALSNLGTAYYRLGRFADAASAYEAAPRLDAKAPLTAWQSWRCLPAAGSKGGRGARVHVSASAGAGRVAGQRQGRALDVARRGL